MKRLLSFIVPAALILISSFSATAAPKRDNYVIFYIKGDCNLEDCIAVVREALRPDAASIVSVDLASLASNQTVDYKTVIITFKDIVTAPYQNVMQQIAALGYNVVSYVIHDTHSGKDVIIPH